MMQILTPRAICLWAGLWLCQSATGQVTYEQILNAQDQPHNWLTYHGSYMSQRYSLLDQIDASNVERLELKWMLQNQVFGAWQSNPIVVDGIMYLTERPNSVMAIDAVTGALVAVLMYEFIITSGHGAEYSIEVFQELLIQLFRK